MTPVVRLLSDDVVLKAGSHASPEQGLCVMEAVAFVAGRSHTDHPPCACPVVSAFLRTWNDALPDDEARTRLLKPLVPKLIDSKSTSAVEEYRALLACDWLIRFYAPVWLDLLPQCASHAKALRELSPVMDAVSAQKASQVTSAADSAAWSEARLAAWSAAARSAASAADSAAWSAADSAAWSAADSAASAAARLAAESALEPTRDRVQLLALDLIDRMLAVTPETLPTGWIPPSMAETRS